MSTEPTTAAPVDEKPEEVMEEHAEKKKGFCPDDWALNCYDPNGDGPGQATCLCKVSCVNWLKILTLFAFYYSFLGLFFWAMIEALFVVKKQGDPSMALATDVY